MKILSMRGKVAVAAAIILGMAVVGITVANGYAPTKSSSGEEFAPEAVTIDPVVVQNMGVRTAMVEIGPVFRNVRTLGEVEVAEGELSVVNLKYDGWIEKIFVDETGSRVEKGQPLFSVYSPQVASAMDEYRLSLSQGEQSPLAKSAYRRLRLLGISKGQLGRVARTGEVPGYLTVSSPRSGFVLHKSAVLGGHAKEGEDLYRIGALGKVWVTAQIYEHDIPWVEAGSPATIEFQFDGGKSWEGTVSYVYPTLNQRSRTLTVRLEFDNPELSLKPGMLATVRIETRRREGVTTVPSEAVLRSGERQLVFVARGYGTYAPREVVTGLMADNDRTEIIEGLEAGEEVVVSGQFMLDSESQLQEAIGKLLRERLQVQDGSAEHRHDGAPDEGGVTYWACPMHPEVISDHFDTCPKCGMDLVRKKR